MNYLEWAERFFSEGQSIEYAQVRPVPRGYRRPWYDIDCSASPLGQRYLTFFGWYHARKGQA